MLLNSVYQLGNALLRYQLQNIVSLWYCCRYNFFFVIFFAEKMRSHQAKMSVNLNSFRFTPRKNERIHTTAIHEQFFKHFTCTEKKTIDNQNEQNVSCFVNISCTRAMYSFCTINLNVCHVRVCVCVFFFCSSCNSLLFVVIVVAAAVFCFRMSICLTQLWNAHRFLQPDKFSDDIKMSLYTVFVLLPMTTFSLQQWKLHSRTKGAKVQSSAFYEYQFFVWQFLCVNHTKKNCILSRLSRVSDLCKNVENVYCSTQSINHKTISHMHNNQLK